jgi:hypothetical protein
MHFAAMQVMSFSKCENHCTILLCNRNHCTLEPRNYPWGSALVFLATGSGCCQSEVAAPYSTEKERVTKCRKIRLIEGNAKCCHLKKFTCKGTLRQVFICLRPRTHTPPPPHTHMLYTGGGESWTREKETWAAWGEYSTDHTVGLKIPTWVNVYKKLAISSL